jgi:hypothetical protein
VYQAFHVAHLQALESLRAKETGPRIQHDLDAAIAKVRKELDGLRRQP